jgi:3',5'-cyclic AMP phosphodiesterase CpdA
VDGNDLALGASVLVDATSASFETTPEAVHEVTDLYRRSGEKLRVGSSAVLVNASAYDRARLYERQATDLGVRVILFNSLDVACVWLGIDVMVASTELKKLRASISLMEGGSQPA